MKATIKDNVRDLLIYICLLIVAMGLVWLAVDNLQRALKEKEEREHKKINIIYKCIKGQLWELSPDRTFYSPSPKSAKCLLSEEVK